MAGALRSFFVSMGYAVDSTSERRFLGSIAQATLGARNLGTAVAATASAVAAAVAHISASYEDMYYASKRTASSVESIRAYTYAITQLGGSAGGAQQSLENLGRNLRLNPGYGQMLRDLGVATSQNGKLRETTAILADFGKVAAKMEYRVGFQYAQALGIDENTYRAIRDNSRALEEYEAEYRRMAQSVGLNSERAAEAGKEFMNASRSLGQAITVIFDKLTEEYAPALTGLLEQFRDWILSNYPLIKQTLEDTGKALLEFVQKIPDMIATMKGAYEVFDEWAKRIGGDGESGIGLAFKLILAYLAGAWLAGLLRTVATASAALGPLIKMLSVLYIAKDVYDYIKDPEASKKSWKDSIEGTKEEQEQSKKDEEVSRREGGFVAGFLKKFLGSSDSQMGNGPVAPSAPGGGDGSSRWWDPRTWGGDGGGGGGSSRYNGGAPEGGARNLRYGPGGRTPRSHAGSFNYDDKNPNTNDGRRSRGAITAQGKENVESWRSFLMQPVDKGGLGMDRDKANAMVAMLQGESGANLRSDHEYWDRNGPSGGVAAWHDVAGKPGGRLEKLKAFAQAQDKSWTDRGVQQQFFRKEMLSTHNSAYKEIMGARYGEGALYAGISRFEIPQNIPGAYQARLPFYNRLRDNNIATPPTASDAQTAAPPVVLPESMGGPKGGYAGVPAKTEPPKPVAKFDTSRFDIPKFNAVPNNGRSFQGTSPVGPGTPANNDNSLSADIKTSNTFNIYGAQDPVNTATEVTRRQSNVANGTLRDIRGITR